MIHQNICNKRLEKKKKKLYYQLIFIDLWSRSDVIGWTEGDRQGWMELHHTLPQWVTLISRIYSNKQPYSNIFNNNGVSTSMLVAAAGVCKVRESTQQLCLLQWLWHA